MRLCKMGNYRQKSKFSRIKIVSIGELASVIGLGEPECAVKEGKKERKKERKKGPRVWLLLLIVGPEQYCVSFYATCNVRPAFYPPGTREVRVRRIHRVFSTVVEGPLEEGSSPLFDKGW
jgi:hypothetical protein